MRTRSIVAVVATTSALVLGSAVAPASAATTVVTTIGGLSVALTDCSSAPNTIVIGADIVAPGTTLSVPCTTTIDLTTNDLTLTTINIESGVVLTVTGPTDGTEGLLTTNASGTAQAAIRTTGATLRVTGGAIHASGGFYGTIGGDIRASGGTFIVEAGTVTAVSEAIYGSAIGGANGGGLPGGNGGVVTITGGSVSASTISPFGVAIGGGAGSPGGHGANITVTGGVLTASGTGSNASTIGGGDEYDGVTGGAGSMTIGTGGTVIVSSSGGSAATVFGPGLSGGTAGPSGTIVVNGELRIPSGVLRMPTGTSVTVGATGRILGSVATPTVGASFVGPGTITNNGVIALAPPAGLVTGNNHVLTYSNGSTPTRVFGPSLDAGYRTLATPPAGTAWNTAANGTGTWFGGTDSTAGTGTTPLFAAGPGSITVSTDPADLVATAGEAFTFPVTQLDSSGVAVSPQPTMTFTSSDCTFTGAGVFETAGTCTITASSTWGPFSPSTTFSITVVAGPLAALAVSPATSTVDAGSPASFTVTGTDAYGNPVPTVGATLSSSVLGDTISGLSVTPSSLGDRTIAASLGSVGTVSPATLTATMPAVVWDAPDLTATAGVGVPLNAVAERADGTPFSPQPSIVYTSTCAFTGSAVFTVAGVCPVTASATLFGQPVSTEFDVTVGAAPASTLTLIPSATSVKQGGSLTFTVTGEDEFGNEADTSAAVLTSSVATDIVTGLSISFPHASPHVITATLGEASTAVTIEVIPTPAAAGMANTGSPFGALALPLALLAALMLSVGLLVIGLRRSAR